MPLQEPRPMLADDVTSWFDPAHRVRDIPGTLTQVDITIQVDRELLMRRVNEVGAGELLRQVSVAAVAVLENEPMTHAFVVGPDGPALPRTCPGAGCEGRVVGHFGEAAMAWCPRISEVGRSGCALAQAIESP